MARRSVYAQLALLATVATVAVLALGACAATKPSLRANIANGAKKVPLETSLQIFADGALIQQALLVRLDTPSEPVSLDTTANGAHIAAKLEPDAQYKLLAMAQPANKTVLPWENSPSAPISLEQTFSTVETPMLDDPDSTRTVLRDKPVELKFSQPLARASVAGSNATASISQKDPRILEVQIPDPTPGAGLAVRVTDVVGVDGVSAPDATLDLQVPSAVRLTGVSDKSISTRIGLPVDVPVTLQWSRPVSFVRFTVDDEAKTWNGNATDTVPLPVKPEEGKSHLVSVVDAVAADGGWLTAPQNFEVMTASPLRVAAMWPENGEMNITPSSAPVFRFSEEIADRATAESAISFEPAVPGRFDWLAPNRVRFLPEDAFPSSTDITVRVDGNPRRIRSASGGYLEDAVTATFTTGKLKLIDVNLSRQTMTLFEEGEVIKTFPVATGVAGAATPVGEYKVQYKMAKARFRGTNPDGSRYDIPNVNWVLAFQGDYTIHGAYWRGTFGRPMSNGCVSLSDPNAKIVFDWSEEGTPIRIHY